MTTMQYAIDKLAVGDTVFFADDILLENAVRNLNASYDHEICSGVITEIVPGDHGVYLDEGDWNNDYAEPVNRFHDVDAIIASEYEMREMLWRAYASACRRAEDVHEEAERKNNGFFRKNFGEPVDVPDCSEFASMFGFDGVGTPVVGFGLVSGYDDAGEAVLLARPASLYERYNGEITEMRIFPADDGESLIETCLEMTADYLR